MSKIVRHTANGVEWLLVGVPNGSEYYNLYNASGDRHIIFIVSPKGILDIDLPNGKYEAQFQFLVSQATESQAAEVVEIPEGGLIINGSGIMPYYANSLKEYFMCILSNEYGFTEDVAVIKSIN